MCKPLRMAPNGDERPSWPPTPLQLAAGAAGLGFALVTARRGPPLSRALRLAGYPVAAAAVPRILSIVTEGRRGWFVAHQLGTVAITTGWLMAGERTPAALNGAWALLALAGWGWARARD